MTRMLKQLSATLRVYGKFLLLAIVLIVFMVWASGAIRKKVDPGTLSITRGLDVPAGAATFTVAIEPIEERIDVVGTVGSEERTHISSRVSAYVKAVSVTAGQTVAKGDVLVTLDDREIREELAAAEAQLKQAASEYGRTKTLSEAAAATSQSLIAAEAAHNAARAQVDRIKVMLTYTELRSPMDGVVTDTRIEAGDLANPGEVLLAVYNPRAMRLEAPVPVRLVGRIDLNQRVVLTFADLTDRHEGKVTEIVSEVEPSSRTRTVKVHIENAGDHILPGSFGRLWVTEETRPGIRIPSTAVYKIGQLEMVQVVRDGRALRRLVRAGPAAEGNVEVLSGLADGDVILVNPVKDARP